MTFQILSCMLRKLHFKRYDNVFNCVDNKSLIKKEKHTL
jgi:hypothetical protein